MKVSIKLQYRDKIYVSNIEDVNYVELEELHDMVKKVVSGSSKFFRFDSNGESIFFPSYIITESIISIIEHEN